MVLPPKQVPYLIISIWDGSKPWYLVNPKIAGKWMFIPLKMVSIGIDPYPYRYPSHLFEPVPLHRQGHNSDEFHPQLQWSTSAPRWRGLKTTRVHREDEAKYRTSKRRITSPGRGAKVISIYLNASVIFCPHVCHNNDVKLIQINAIHNMLTLTHHAKTQRLHSLVTVTRGNFTSCVSIHRPSDSSFGSPRIPS